MGDSRQGPTCAQYSRHRLVQWIRSRLGDACDEYAPQVERGRGLYSQRLLFQSSVCRVTKREQEENRGRWYTHVARVPWAGMNLGSGVFLIRLCHARSMA